MNIEQLVLGALKKKVFYCADIAANIDEPVPAVQKVLSALVDSGKIVYETVQGVPAYRFADKGTELEKKVLEAIDDKCCTLPQIKRHAEIDRSFNLMPTLEAMIFDGLIVRRTDEAETLTAYFRKNLIPPKFYLGNGIVEGDWENAAPDDTEARMERARRKSDELAFSPKEKEEEEIKSVVEKSQPKPGSLIGISAEQVRKFAALGQTQEQIAESLGISRYTFIRRLKDTEGIKEALEEGYKEFKAKEGKSVRQKHSPTRDKFLQHLADLQTWAQEGKSKKEAAELLGVTENCFSTYFYSVAEVREAWEKGLEIRMLNHKELSKSVTSKETVKQEPKNPRTPMKSPVRDKILANLDLIEQYAFEGKSKGDIANALSLSEIAFSGNYFYSIPGVKEAWEKGEKRRDAQQDTVFDKVPAEAEKPTIEQVAKELSNNGLTPEGITLATEVINESLQTDYAKIPVTPEEDEAFEELAEKLNTNVVAHKLKFDSEASGDYVGKSLPTGLKHIVGDSAPGPVKLDCPPNCGHTKEQHEFFDSGYQNGLEGIASPYIDPSISPDLREIFLNGYSVGLICYRDNLKAVWKKRGYDDAVIGKVNQSWELSEHHLFEAEGYNEGYEDGLKQRDADSVKAELKNESFLDHPGDGDEIPKGDWKILPAPKISDGEKVEIVGVPAVVGGTGNEPVEIDPRFANTVTHLSVNGRSKEGFERKKQEFLNNLPELKNPDITSGRTFILPDTIEPRPGNFKTLIFGNLTVRLAVEGNLFDAPKEVRDALEGLFDWAEKNAK